MMGKNFFVVDPFVVWSHWSCHLAMLWSCISLIIVLLGILSKDISYVRTHIYTHTHTYIFICVYIYTYAQTCINSIHKGVPEKATIL
jgi:hypothetical protein